MKKFIFIFLFFISSYSWASAPSSTYTYVSGQAILPNQVQTNENNIYSYLQSGVDTYKAGSITDAAISSSAGILYSQLNLSGGILPTDINTSTTTNIYTFQNVTIPYDFEIGTNHEGDILYDSTSDGGGFIRLVPSQGGEILTSNGTTSAPSYATNSIYKFASSSPSLSTSVSIAPLQSAVKYNLIFPFIMNTSSGDMTITFNGDTGSNYKYACGILENSGGGYSHQGSNSATGISATVATDISSGTYGLANITFSTVPGNNDNVIVSTNVSYTSGVAASTPTVVLCSGLYAGSASLSSITLTTSAGSYSGTVSAYEMN